MIEWMMICYNNCTIMVMVDRWLTIIKLMWLINIQCGGGKAHFTNSIQKRWKNVLLFLFNTCIQMLPFGNILEQKNKRKWFLLQQHWMIMTTANGWAKFESLKLQSPFKINLSLGYLKFLLEIAISKSNNACFIS